MKSCCAVVVLGLFYFQTYGFSMSPGVYIVRAVWMWHLKNVEELWFRCMLSDCLLSSLSYGVRICDFNLLFNVVKDTWVLSLKSTHKGMDWARLCGKRSEDSKKQFIFAYSTWSLGVFLGMMSYLLLEHHNLAEFCCLRNIVADALGAKQMWVDHMCLEPTPDLEEEASERCV